MSYPSLPYNSKIITLAIVTHGNISQFNLTPENQHLFDNVRLFSKAGKFQEAVTTPFIEYTNILPPLNERFRQDKIDGTLNILQTYAEDLNEKYNNLLDSMGERHIDRSRVCKIYYPITFDKQFVVVPPTFLETPYCIIPSMQGIYVISVHEQREKLEYIFPNRREEINLLKPNDFLQFAKALGIQTPKNKTILTRQYDENGKTFIFMSELVKTIKDMVTDPLCYINIVDHSCSVTNTARVSQEEVDRFEKYVVPADIEMGAPTWGGRRKNTTRKKRDKSTKKRKRRRANLGGVRGRSHRK
jgi:hypothetical protein